MFKKRLVLFLSCLFVLCLSACSKEKNVNNDFGNYESKEVIRETDIFAVDENIEVESAPEKDNNEYFNKYINDDRSHFTEEEIEELNEIDNDTFTDKISGEVVNFSDLRNIDVMRQDAANGWKEDYISGVVTKEEIQDYFNIMYEEIDKNEIQKVIDEIISEDKEVDTSNITYDETCSSEELQEIINNLEKEGIGCNDVGFADVDNMECGDSTGLPALQAN